MRSLLGFLKNRAFLIALGVLCLALIVWFGGPYVGFASVVGRLLVILALVVIWGIIVQVRQMRDARANAELSGGGESKDAASGGSPGREDRAGRGGERGAESSAEARALREVFAEATTFLRHSPGGGRSLYELPWYAIIGPPGTGKTTLIEKSGLKFPQSQRAGARKVTGVAGTRNCQWWFTNEAILLDTAGRFTTQDSNAAVDRDGWREFLALLRKYRPRRPLNGLFVAYSAADLASKSAEDLTQDALVVRERLNEIQQALRISVPVYVLVTQSDLLSGFVEFFDDLGPEARKQVWGFTFDFKDSQRGAALEQLGAEFTQLADRLASRLMTRLQEERDLQRRIALMSFPAQFAALQERLETFVQEVFGSSRFERSLMLRGVYLSSGTQVGTPVDRVMAAVAREFGVSPRTSDRPNLAGRAFFIEQLLREVVFPESGLAGTDRRLEIGKAAGQLAAYAACLVLGVLSVIWLTVSYARNSSYLRDVSTAFTGFKQIPDATATSGVEPVLLRLDGLKTVVDTAERNGEPAPWSMRYGLYQAHDLGEDARAAYVRVINETLVPILDGQLRERLGRVGTDPENLFETLRAYLAVHDPSKLDDTVRQGVSDVASDEWTFRYNAEGSRLTQHLVALLQSKQALEVGPQDVDTIARARSSLHGLTAERLVYRRIARAYSANPDQGLPLTVAAGLNSDKVFIRRSGRPLTEPLPYLYTRAAFSEISTQAAATASVKFVQDAWVFGDQHQSLADQARLPFKVLSLYEDDYITHWDQFIADVGLKPVSGAANVASTLTILAAGDSPLRILVKSVDDNTDLVKPGDDAKKANPLAQLEGSLQAKLGGGTVPPGTRITEHFRPVFSSGPAVDKCLASLQQLAQQLNASGPTNSSGTALTQGGAVDLASGLQLCAASLPASLGGVMKQASAASQAAAVAQASGQLGDRLSDQVGPDCKEVISSGYPFVASSSNDVPLGDFGRVFGAGGELDGFFQANLASLVKKDAEPWRWQNVNNIPLSMPPTVLPAFQRADRVRKAFFAQGGQQPHIHFTLTMDSLDSKVKRFVLEIDGQQLVAAHDPAAPWGANWPGPAPGLTTLRFEDLDGIGTTASQQGPWGWFRLLAGAQIERISSTRYFVNFQLGGKTARVRLDADTLQNPFERGLLDGFKCPG